MQLTQYMVYGIFAMSLSLLWGYAGILCFGHAIFFGIGAYVMALITKGMMPGFTGFLTSTWIGLLLAVLSVAFFALVLGYFLFYGRLSGPYLGIVTLAISVILERVAVNWDYIGGFQRADRGSGPHVFRMGDQGNVSPLLLHPCGGAGPLYLL